MDGAYLLKTLPSAEARSLLRMLPAYARHLRTNPHSLLPRFFGLYSLRQPNRRRKLTFAVMNNVFCAAPPPIRRRFDLKGSSVGRTARRRGERAPQPGAVWKDLDLRVPFAVESAARDAIVEQLRRDVRLLRRARTLDYSLLIGTHSPAPADDDEAGGGADGAAAGADDTDGGDGDDDDDDDGDDEGLGVPPWSLESPPWSSRPDGGVCSEGARECGELYYLGLIDTLTPWGARKACEWALKQLLHWCGRGASARSGVSCVPPEQYAARFEAAMQDWFVAAGGSRV